MAKNPIQFQKGLSLSDFLQTKERFILLGNSIHSRLLIVCHCIRSNEVVRIISARKADKRERIIYEEFRHA